MRSKLWLIAWVGLLFSTFAPAQQNMPPEYSAVLASLGRQGDFKDGVLKVTVISSSSAAGLQRYAKRKGIAANEHRRQSRS